MRTCDKRPLIGPAIDGELGLFRHARLRTHLALCRACATEFRQQRRLRHLIRQIGAFRPSRAAAPPQAPNRVTVAWPTGQWIGLAASMALIAGLVVANMLPRDDPELRRALISSHVRTLQADHRSDGLADGDRLLAPWLAARIGLALPVVDLEADGYPLVDTRSDTVGDHAAAVFVYRARDHVINVFVWADPSSEDELTPGAWSAEGYSVCHWRRREAAFFAVSDLSADQVNAFEQLYKMRHRSLARRLRVGMIG